MVASTTSLPSEYANTMSFVNHYAGIIFLLQFYNLGQFCEVAFHREKPVGNNHLDGIRIATHKLTFQMLHVVVFVA